MKSTPEHDPEDIVPKAELQLLFGTILAYLEDEDEQRDVRGPFSRLVLAEMKGFCRLVANLRRK